MEDESKYTAAAKAPSDIYRICEERGYKKYIIPVYYPKHDWLIELIYGCIHYIYYWMKLFLIINNNDILLFQHPSPGAPVMGVFLLLSRWRGCRAIAMIHDLESLRHGVYGNISSNRGDFKDGYILKRANVVICHNRKMRKYLLRKGFFKNQVIPLYLFDYLDKGQTEKKFRRKKLEIDIAGNLSPQKSGYIYKIKSNYQNRNLRINLYGINYVEEKGVKDKLVYKGSHSPEELPSVLSGSFGLVWDGPDTDTCSGNTGRYLLYNNPHKLSLYIAAGLPVIVWKEAAVADYVQRKGIGILVNSLDNIEDRIASISEMDYTLMCSRINSLSEKVRSGYFFKHAFDCALEKLG